MLLNHNPFEIIAGVFAMAFAFRSGWWMFKELKKDDPDRTDFNQD